MDVFVYGTLTDPDRARSVVADASFAGDATLYGLRRVDGAYPTLVPPGDGADAAGAVEGRILRTADVGSLDVYEGVERGLYRRVTVPSPRGPVALYVGDPARLDAPGEWPCDGSFEERVDRFLRENDVRVERD
ncbi:gamma-glutamylcyclotransferase family protein [Halomarina litorea]|uniref:gamma-glutamylcyclotransferase family protein n=1 Tax=Halomarina litorea TaxID=2961595 RepID=UPI0020C46AD2|nr:gamma-glutamylcyclotransferase family protein [Halomarina sp. BCD28]